MDRNVAGRRVASSAPRSRPLLTSGAVIAGVGLLLSPGVGVAQADGVNWDAVAQCESNGNWSADTGNGFYGGLQFKESTWREFGGVGSPSDASRDQQIAVANRVLAVQGPEAWPKCGPGMQRPGVHWPKPLRSIARTVWSWVPH
ncbi:transglycosylase family protein [Mycolicibacillus trivialis]|uniref:Resuscitation-promoting n=1 Tax=Mycolicibacillus trivialis TaxID=1798 RepID=A0A1X2EG10_9MYCO|nr:resuscitation-promoting [Mycolicibacillus trivialis]